MTVDVGRRSAREPLRALRKRLGMTQQDLAVRLGFSVVGVARWECGERIPTVSSLKTLIAFARENGAEQEAEQLTALRPGDLKHGVVVAALRWHQAHHTEDAANALAEAVKKYAESLAQEQSQ